MKKFLTALTVIIITVLAMPRVAFAADEPLESIPKRSSSESGKAYCLYEKTDGGYTLSCVNSAGTILLYRSEEKFKHAESFSDDGKTLYYSINDKVYKYSHESGKRQKIYTALPTFSDSDLLSEGEEDTVYITALYSSPDGEYCFIHIKHWLGNFGDDLVVWHNGKTVSQPENIDLYPEIQFEDEVTRSEFHLFGINNRGEAFYTLDRDVYILDLSGKRLVQKAPVPLSKEKDDYRITLYLQSGTYIAENDKDLYFGALGGEQHKMSFPEYAGFYIIGKNGKGLILYNGEYVARYDIKSGKHKIILKISPEQYSEKHVYFMKASGDLNEVAFINYSKNKLVRLSGWDGENNCYTKKQEIKLNGTGKERIIDYTSSMNIILISYYDENNSRWAYWTADFKNESFVNTGYWNEIDRFGHMIVHTGDKIKIITLDGSSTEVFDGVGTACKPHLSNGFYVFYSGGPDDDYEYEGRYPLTFYYIDKNGKAVKWYEETVYLENHIIDEFLDE